MARQLRQRFTTKLTKFTKKDETAVMAEASGHLVFFVPLVVKCLFLR